MTFSAGARLGPYEILSLVGSGGMGEVYRARDRKLNREVAIKVLPEAFTTDSDRVARFEREAHVLAALNHPSIAHIYGFERSRIGSRSVPYHSTRHCRWQSISRRRWKPRTSRASCIAISSRPTSKSATTVR